MDKQHIINSVFGVPRALIGVVHVQALPGAPACRFDIPTIVAMAVDDARLYRIRASTAC